MWAQWDERRGEHAAELGDRVTTQQATGLAQCNLSYSDSGVGDILISRIAFGPVFHEHQ